MVANLYGGPLLRSLMVAVAMSIFFQTSFADTIWVAGQKEPHFGIVESTSGGKVQFRKTIDGIAFEPVEFDQESVQLIVRSFDSKRLGSLRPGSWEAWQEYAEELFAQRKDPVARVLSMRLLVIVLGNSKDANQRESALSDLIGLARSDKERRKLLQLQYLETGKPLPETESKINAAMPPLENRKLAAQQVKAVRMGRGTIDPGDENLKQVISRFAKTCSWQELVQISRANRISNQSFRVLVALEIELLSASGDKGPTVDQQTEWHALADRVGTSSLKLPTVSNVTEFDPLATRFQNGTWIRQ